MEFVFYAVFVFLQCHKRSTGYELYAIVLSLQQPGVTAPWTDCKRVYFLSFRPTQQ